MNQKHRNINKYLKLEAEGLEGFFTGQILCIVALICWYLMVAKEAVLSLFLGPLFPFLFFFFFLSRFDFVYNQVLLQILNLSIIRHAVGFAAWLRRCAR